MNDAKLIQRQKKKKLMETIHKRDGVLCGGKLDIMDGLAGKGLFAHFDIPKDALITFFGIPANPLDSYRYGDNLPEANDHIYLLIYMVFFITTLPTRVCSQLRMRMKMSTSRMKMSDTRSV